MSDPISAFAKNSGALNLFVTGILAAALIMLGTHRDFQEFFQRFNTGQVEHQNSLEDPVAGLIRVIQRHRMDDHAMPSRLSVDLCRKAIQSITIWEEGRDSHLYWRRKLVSGIDHMPYIREMKGAKHIDREKELLRSVLDADSQFMAANSNFRAKPVFLFRLDSSMLIRRGSFRVTINIQVCFTQK